MQSVQTIQPAQRELTVRAFITAIVVAVLIGASYPYVVLKIGYGPNISVVSAFFGYMALTLIGTITGVRGTRFENNIVQTAGTTAGQAGFMCVVLAAFDMLRQKPELGFNVELSGVDTFIWLTLAGLLGVLLAVPLRKHYIEDEGLVFADGTAAGETLLILDQDREQAKVRVRALNFGLVLSGVVAFIRDKFKWIPGEVAFGEHGHALRMGTEVSLLSFGSGLLVGFRISLSMAIGMVLSWIIAPGMLVSRGIVPAETFKDVLRWTMWPATGLMVAGGLTALVLKWKTIARSFQGLSTKGEQDSREFPLKWVIAGVVVLSIALAVQQFITLGFPIWLSLVSIGLSLGLMLVGTRVLGETNWAPISALANLMQAVFAVIAPGNINVNMIGSGMSGTVAANGEHLMQDFKAGHIVGSTPRNLTIMQLCAVPVGAASVAFAYQALKAQYGIGGEGLSSPISVKWAGFAELLKAGFGALPAGCFAAMLVAILLGILMTVLEPKYHRFVPSPTGVGIGMLVPGFAVMPMFIGGLVKWIWESRSPETEERYSLPVASGFIAGEALIVLFMAIAAMIAS